MLMYFIHSCPRASQLGGDESQAAMLCLLCGEMLCSNSYCCRKSVQLEGEETVQLGGMANHTLRYCTVNYAWVVFGGTI